MNQQNADWPGVDAAYAFVLPSYQLLTSRFEAADTRIVSLMTFASSVTLAAPILARSVKPDIPFSSLLFIAALGVFVLIMVCGLGARIKGELILPNPRIIHETALAKPDWQFKADAIHIAGEHFDENARVINGKGKWSIALTFMVLVEMVLLVSWIAQ